MMRLKRPFVLSALWECSHHGNVRIMGMFASWECSHHGIVRIMGLFASWDCSLVIVVLMLILAVITLLSDVSKWKRPIRTILDMTILDIGFALQHASNDEFEAVLWKLNSGQLNFVIKSKA